MEIREVLGLPPVDDDIAKRFGPPTYTEEQVKAYAAAASVKLTHALRVWLEAMETGRSEPLFVARDHTRRLLDRPS